MKYSWISQATNDCREIQRICLKNSKKPTPTCAQIFKASLWIWVRKNELFFPYFSNSISNKTLPFIFYHFSSPTRRYVSATHRNISTSTVSRQSIWKRQRYIKENICENIVIYSIFCLRFAKSVFSFLVQIADIYRSNKPVEWPTLNLNASLDLRHVTIIADLIKYQERHVCPSCYKQFTVCIHYNRDKSVCAHPAPVE